jgi:HD-GYP domain-containing protein (c-di-GMP phosphodiesterase class II)
VEKIRLAGLLHDIGKSELPHGILDKPGPLTSREWDRLRKHPEAGARLLSDPMFDDIRSWVLAHHERVDGLGYPLGLHGGGIPIAARILTVADAYEAMTSDRPYRRALAHEDAAEELRACAGTQFDAEIVEAFLAAVERERMGSLVGIAA